MYKYNPNLVQIDFPIPFLPVCRAGNKILCIHIPVQIIGAGLHINYSVIGIVIVFMIPLVGLPCLIAYLVNFVANQVIVIIHSFNALPCLYILQFGNILPKGLYITVYVITVMSSAVIGCRVAIINIFIINRSYPFSRG